MSPSSPSPRAPWHALFQKHVSQMSATEFSLATVWKDDNGIPLPRVRMCIFRGFFGELNLHPSAQKDIAASASEDDPGMNPAVYESEMPTFSTDIRMAKIWQIRGKAGDELGGDVECLFWVKEVSAQWRLKGKAYIIGGDRTLDPLEDAGREEIKKWLRVRNVQSQSEQSGNVEQWSWEKEVTAHFANIAPMMRGSFKNPLPGSSKSATKYDPDLKQGEMVHDLHDPVARKNFRVVVIVLNEVEVIDLSEIGKSTRFRWKLTKGTGETDFVTGNNEDGQWHWVEEELWP
ncbi:hypothetical protein FQN57_000566 [Myotisia sp. PD_48]|nr:hypothetical protein FQN57_000566 [Myotisia sp. PD_48]